MAVSLAAAAWLDGWGQIPAIPEDPRTEDGSARLPYHLLGVAGWWIVCIAAVGLTAASPSNSKSVGSGRTGGAWWAAATSGLLATALAAWFGWDLRTLPPLYHDEVSYLFQARTFLAGRWSWPSPDPAPAFAEMHVLVEPAYASRYFPGTGLALAPFLALGVPWLSGWIFAGLIAAGTSLWASRWSTLAGWLAGLSIAISPFSIALAQMRLSPAPTIIAILAFLLLGDRLPLANSPRTRWCHGILAGLALGFAIATRPLTALALAAAPLAALWFTPNAEGERTRGSTALPLAAVSLGVLPWLIALMIYNQALTGSVFLSPYSLYTQQYTPAHSLGFDNVRRSEGKVTLPGSPTAEAYNAWARNLTWPLAIELLWTRCQGLARDTLGPILVPTLAILVLGRLAALGVRGLVTLLSIGSLAVAYFPFAFEGILGWSYLFEAAPLVLALMAAALADVLQQLQRPWVTRLVVLAWLSPAVGLVLPVVPLGGAAVASLFEPGSELRFPREAWAHRQEFEAELAEVGPILVLVRLDVSPTEAMPATLVHNDPGLNGPIVRAWDQPGVADRFPDRAVYRLHYRGLFVPPRYEAIRKPVTPK